LAEEGRLLLLEAPQLFGFYHNPRHSRRDHVALYVARVSQEGPRAPDWEIAECGFYPLGALPEDATEATRARVAEFLGLAPIDNVWREK
jgi:ADP-ribose pyrophosphatase YjhB (NUDIX family)